MFQRSRGKCTFLFALLAAFLLLFAVSQASSASPCVGMSEPTCEAVVMLLTAAEVSAINGGDENVNKGGQCRAKA
jgi:hypothetical protein